MSLIEKRLRASVAFGVVHGDHMERSVCESQMMEAAHEIEMLRTECNELQGALEKLNSAISSYLCVVDPGGESVRSSSPSDFDAVEPDFAAAWQEARDVLAKAGGQDD